MGKWEWECSVGMGMGGNGNKNDSMGVGREWEQEIHSRTPLIPGVPGGELQTLNAATRNVVPVDFLFCFMDGRTQTTVWNRWQCSKLGDEVPQ